MTHGERRMKEAMRKKEMGRKTRKRIGGPAPLPPPTRAAPPPPDAGVYPMPVCPNPVKSRAATVLLLVVFFLGVLNAGILIYQAQDVSTPSDVLPEKSGEVTGRVMDPQGRPIQGATVSVVDTSFEGTTNREGWYLIERVPVGEYYVKASMDGYKAQTRSEMVEKNMPRTIDFTLTPGQSGTEISDETPPSKERSFSMDYTVSGVISLALSFTALAGALATFTLKNHWVAMGLATASIFSFGFGAGSVLAIISLVLIILARTEFCPTERVERGRRVLARQRLCTAEGEAIDVEVIEDAGWLMFDEVELTEDEGGAGVGKECAVPEGEFEGHGLAEKKAELELDAMGTPAARSDEEGRPVTGWRARGREVRSVGPEVVPKMEKALKETLKEEERRRQFAKRAEWKAKMDKDAGKGGEKKEGKEDEEEDEDEEEEETEDAGEEGLKVRVAEPPKPTGTGEMTTDEQEMDIVESVLKKLDIHKPEEPAKGKPKAGSRLEAFSASGTEWSQDGLVCRSCVKSILLVTNVVRCKCGMVYHRECVAKEGRCLNCRRVYRGKGK